VYDPLGVFVHRQLLTYHEEGFAMNLVSEVTVDSEAQLAQLVAELAGRIERGEVINLGACCEDNPLWAEQVGTLVPVLERLSLLRRRMTHHEVALL
jgi:hypothetical protein